MRTALCITGHFREFDHVWPSLRKHIIERFNPDIFALSWSDSFGLYQHKLDQRDPSFALGYDPKSPQVPPGYIEDVQRRMNPIVLRVVDPIKLTALLDYLIKKYAKVESLYDFHRPRSKYQMMWARSQCMALKREYEAKQGFTYDRVIYTRWDILHENTIPDAAFTDERLVIPRTYTYNGPGDIWLSGSSWQLDAFGNMLDDIDTVMKTAGFHTNPHEWLRDQLAYYQIETVMMPIPVSIFNRPYYIAPEPEK
jgi:hypothetical protein